MADSFVRLAEPLPTFHTGSELDAVINDIHTSINATQ